MKFAFVVPAIVGSKELTKWTYRFEPATDGGTDVTESFEILNDLPWIITFGDRYMLGIKDRKADLIQAMSRHFAEDLRHEHERLIHSCPRSAPPSSSCSSVTTARSLVASREAIP